MVVVPDCADPLEAIISNLIEYMLFADALVIAESYHARANTEESLHILVKCLMLLRRFKAVHSMLRKETLPSPRIRYFYAKSCCEIGEFQDAELALCEARVAGGHVEIHHSFQNSPASPLAHLLLAQIIVETGSEDVYRFCAGNEFRFSVKENPFIYSALKGFCEVNYNSKDDVAKMMIDQFKEVRQQFAQQQVQEHPKRTRSRKASTERPSSQASSRSTRSASTKDVTPLNPRTSTRQAENVAKKASVNAALAAAPKRTSTRSMQSRDESKKRTRAGASGVRHGLRSENASRRESSDVLQMNAMNTIKSRRVLNSSGTPSVLKANARKLGTNKKTAPLAASNRQQPEEHHVSSVAVTMPIVMDPSTSFGYRPFHNDENQVMLENDYGMKPCADYYYEDGNANEKASDVYPIFGDVVDYLTRIAIVQRFLSRFESGKAKKILELGFSPCFQNTALVLELRARASFELSDYKEVVTIMDKFRKLYPYLPNGLEILSTALWHLQDTHSLSGLAKSVMTDLDDTAEAWCVNGNCFSVQKKHDMAIECLTRATSINPRFAYGYTLLGHELVDVEQSDKAIEAFSTALQYCPNEYRAYYGLALVHYKREEIDEAHCMLSEAISINRHSTVILCQLAKVEQRRGRAQKADQVLRKALEMSPDNVAVRYHYAENLVTLQRYDQALEVLKVLKQLSPDEPNIYTLIGRLFRKIGNEHLGQLNINWARDMDPRTGHNHSVLSERRYEEEETPQRPIIHAPGQNTPRYQPAPVALEDPDEQMDEDDAASMSDSMNDSPFTT